MSRGYFESLDCVRNAGRIHRHRSTTLRISREEDVLQFMEENMHNRFVRYIRNETLALRKKLSGATTKGRTSITPPPGLPFKSESTQSRERTKQSPTSGSESASTFSAHGISRWHVVNASASAPPLMEDLSIWRSLREKKKSTTRRK